MSVSDAIDFAKRAHAGATDKGGRPYIDHIMRVYHYVKDADRIAAILHDVVEDTPVTLTELEKLGIRRTDLQTIDALTRRAGEPYERYLERVRENPVAQRVKIADLIDNVDEERLELLEPEVATRLREKYTLALDALEGAEEATAYWRERQIKQDLISVVLGEEPMTAELVQRADAIAEFPCALCPQAAGRLVRLSGWVLRSGFQGHATFRLRGGRLGPYQWAVRAFDTALLAHDCEALRGQCSEYVPWSCRPCGRAFCERHWQFDVRYDDGFYDCTYGTCPKGHTVNLDD